MKERVDAEKELGLQVIPFRLLNKKMNGLIFSSRYQHSLKRQINEQAKKELGS